MHNPLIKICGIKNPEIVSEIARLGADFIGVIFHPQSKRHVNIQQAKAISLSAKKNNILPVAVFVDQSALDMQEICLKTDIQVIQLHGSTARKEHFKLANHYQRIYVQPVAANGDIMMDEDDGFIHCDLQRDYILFDHVKAGIGKSFDWENFKYTHDFRLGLAGGLTPNNVALAIKKFKPALVDVSSGVEDLSGKKDLHLIKKFIEAIYPHKRGVSYDNK